jgi:predicted methyltransferase
MFEKRRLPLAVEWAHRVLADKLQPGAWAIDATAGNGHDTLFLTQQVGPQGRIFAFDIQPEALETTRSRLAEHHIPEETYRLILESHARLREALPEEALGRIDAIMFNLGFRPGCDKQLTTHPSSTLAGLAAAATLLAPGGVLTVVAYPGHEVGQSEAEKVAAWMGSLPPEHYEVQNVSAINRVHLAPQLWLVLRR